MVNCKNCQADCANKRLDRPRKSCLGYSGGTNADRIRAMSNEELAEWHKKIIDGYCPRPSSECPYDCYACWLDWLKSPVEVEDF